MRLLVVVGVVAAMAVPVTTAGAILTGTGVGVQCDGIVGDDTNPSHRFAPALDGSDTVHPGTLRITIDLSAETSGLVVLGHPDNAGTYPSWGGDLVIDGTPFDDKICGSTGNDDIDGGAGNDLVAGERGRDTVDGEAGNDRVFGGNSGQDGVDPLDGNDILLGGDGDDILRGGVGDDWLDGGPGDDVVKGQKGNDANVPITVPATLVGGLGGTAATAANQFFTGGTGNDEIRAGSGNDGVLGSGGVTGGTGDDLIRGGNGVDQLDGGDGADKVIGGPGDDDLLGGDGADLVKGGPGNDDLNGGDGDDRVKGGTGNDGNATGAFTGTATGLIGAAPFFTGGLGNDRINGGSGNDNIDEFTGAGVGGNDIIKGLGGDDRLLGGAGNDTIEGGDGNEGDGSAVVAGVTAGAINAFAQGFTAAGPHIDGGAGNDILDGGAGNDDIITGTGTDSVTGGSGNDEVDASAGGLLTAVLGTGTDSIDFDDTGTAVPGANSIDTGDGPDRVQLETSLAATEVTVDLGGADADPDGVTTTGGVATVDGDIFVNSHCADQGAAATADIVTFGLAAASATTTTSNFFLAANTDAQNANNPC